MIVKNTIIYTIGGFIPQVVNLFLLPYYTHYLSPADYGIINAVLILQLIFSLFFGFSLDRALMRLYWDIKGESEKKIFLGTVTIGTILISSLCFIFIFIFQKYFSLIYDSVPFHPYILWGSLITFISVFFQITFVIIRLQEKAILYVVLSFLQLLFTNFFIIVFVVFDHPNAFSYLKGTLVGLLFLLPFLFYVNIKEIKIKFSFSIFKKCINFSWPFLPILIAAWIISYSDRIFIERYLSIYEVGLYSFAYKIASPALIFCTAFNMAYDPTFFKLANSSDNQNAKKKLQSDLNLWFFFLVFLFFLVSLFTKEIIFLFFGSEYQKAALYIPLFSFTFFLHSIGSMVGRYYQQNQRNSLLMWIAILSAAISILLNAIFINYFGLIGICISSIIAAFFYMYVMYYMAKNFVFFIPIKLMEIIFLYFGLISVIILIDNLIPADKNYIQFIIKGIILSIICFILFKKYYLKIKLLLTKK